MVIFLRLKERRRSGGSIYDDSLLARILPPGDSGKVIEFSRGNSWVAKIFAPLRILFSFASLGQSDFPATRKGQSGSKSSPTILINTSNCFYFLPLVFWQKLRGNKLWTITHLFLHKELTGWRRPLYRHLEHLMVRLADVSIGPSDITMCELSSLRGSREMRYLPIEVPGPNPPVTDADVLRKSEDSDRPLRILFAGNIERRKGLHHLLDALEIAAADGLIFHLDIIGDDADKKYAEEMRERCRLLSKENIVWHGWVEGDEKDSLFRQADLMTFCSTTENFGIVIAEAKAYRLPVVTLRSEAAEGQRVDIICDTVTEMAEALVSSFRRKRHQIN